MPKATKHLNLKNICKNDKNDDVEYKTMAASILGVLDNTLHKFKIISRLASYIKEDGEILHKYLDNTESKSIQLLFKIPVMGHTSHLSIVQKTLDKINLNKRIIENVKRGQFSIGVSHILEIIFNCKPLVEYLDQQEKDIFEIKKIPIIKDFGNAVVNLREIVNEKLKVSVEEEIKEIDALTTAYRRNLTLTNNIKDINQRLKEETRLVKIENIKKQNLINEFNKKIEENLYINREEIDDMYYRCEAKMMKDYNKSIQVQETLSKEAKTANVNLKKVLEDHIRDESISRARRLKIEAQLSNWVTKFDSDLGEKQVEYERLQAMHAKEKEEIDILQEIFNEQDIKYTRLMNEMIAEERRVFEEKAYLFLANRSARIIQRSWRAHRKRKQQRRRARQNRQKRTKKKKK